MKWKKEVEKRKKKSQEDMVEREIYVYSDFFFSGKIRVNSAKGRAAKRFIWRFIMINFLKRTFSVDKKSEKVSGCCPSQEGVAEKATGRGRGGKNISN